MTIRKPEPKAAVRMLRDAFAAQGATLNTQPAYDLFAQLEGFKNWSHYKAHETQSTRTEPAKRSANDPNPGTNVPASGTSASHGARSSSEVDLWPVWVFCSDYDDEGEEVLFVLPSGATLKNRAQSRRSYEPFDASGAIELPSMDFASDDERLASIVVREVFAMVPRIDRYGIPTFANDREVAEWACEEMGWGYLATHRGESLVEVECHDTGDDSASRFWAEVHVAPQYDAVLRRAFAQQPPEVSSDVTFRAGAYRVELCELEPDDEFLWADLYFEEPSDDAEPVTAMSRIQANASGKEREQFARMVAETFARLAPNPHHQSRRALEKALVDLVQSDESEQMLRRVQSMLAQDAQYNRNIR